MKKHNWKNQRRNSTLSLGGGVEECCNRKRGIMYPISYGINHEAKVKDVQAF